MKPFTISVATEAHLPYAKDVVQALEDASKSKGTGLATRSLEYIESKSAREKR